MPLYYYIPIIVLFVLIFCMRRKNAVAIAKKIIEKRTTEGNIEMVTLAKNFLEKECLIYSFDGHKYEGFIKEVSDCALLIEKNGTLEAINLDFVVRIREFPKDKKGKKKSVVLD